MSPKAYKKLRESVGSQAYVADILGVAISTIERRENGKVPISQEAVISITQLAKNTMKVSIKRFKRDADPAETGIMISPAKPWCQTSNDEDFSAVIAGSKAGGFYLDEVKPKATRKHRKPSKRKS